MEVKTTRPKEAEKPPKSSLFSMFHRKPAHVVEEVKSDEIRYADWNDLRIPQQAQRGDIVGSNGNTFRMRDGTHFVVFRVPPRIRAHERTVAVWRVDYAPGYVPSRGSVPHGQPWARDVTAYGAVALRNTRRVYLYTVQNIGADQRFDPVRFARSVKSASSPTNMKNRKGYCGRTRVEAPVSDRLLRNAIVKGFF